MTDPNPNWPVYELVTVTAPPGVALTPASLRVPREWFGYRAEEHLIPFATPRRPNLICFGSSRYFLKHVGWSNYCLDAASGEVVNIQVDQDGRVPDRDQTRFEFVNSSLEQFNRSIEYLIRRYPYDDGNVDYDRDDGYWDRIADELIAELRAIDPNAFSDENGHGHWPEFYWDVTIGDFAVDLMGIKDSVDPKA